MATAARIAQCACGQHRGGATAAIRKGPADAEAMYDEIVDLFHRHQR
jgi:hypothetical protein